MAANCIGIEPLPVKAGSPSKPVPGYDIRILDEGGTETDAGREGAVAVRLPLPPGTLSTLWRADDRFVDSYMSRIPGYYTTGDGGYFDEDGYLFVMGRVDDVINVAGHRLSTGAIEEVLASHADVAECAVIGVPDELRGQVPLGLVVLKAGIDRESREVNEELVALVRERVGAFACYRETRVVARLPKTRSGKILRSTMRSIAAGRDYSVPSTIDDSTALAEIEAAIGRSARVSSS
jgi:propionyl-CoA synthetase